MFDLDRWQEVLTTLSRNKLRTFLTACGVFWGMFMLLVMLGFGNGLERSVMKNMSSFATNSVYIWGQRTSMPYKGRQPGRWVGYKNGDVEAIRSSVPGIAHLAPRNQIGGYRSGVNVTRGVKTGNFSIMGDYPQYRHIQVFDFERGRFINRLDIEQRRKVAVLGKQVVKELYAPGEDPIGTYLKVRGVYFQVVGVFRSSRADEQGDREESTVHVPFTTFQQAFNYGDSVGWFAVTGSPEYSASTIEEQVRKVLAERHRIHPDDDQAIGSFNAEKEFTKMSNLFAGIRYFVWFVGTATLLSGVVGVSNILLIVVKERTGEIGIRRALGATPLSVVSMVIQEAVVLTSLAGYSGLVVGVGILELVSLAVGEGNEVLTNPQIDLSVSLAAAFVLVVSGAIAGIIPARHAAKIHPVVALREGG